MQKNNKPFNQPLQILTTDHDAYQFQDEDADQVNAGTGYRGNHSCYRADECIFILQQKSVDNEAVENDTSESSQTEDHLKGKMVAEIKWVDKVYESHSSPHTPKITELKESTVQGNLRLQKGILGSSR